MNNYRSPRALAIAISLVALTVSAVAADGNLELRWQTRRGIAESGPTVPRDAVKVFVYEGTPRDVNVNDNTIAVSYDQSGVLFDRATGEPVRRFTITDGWPGERWNRRTDGRPDAFKADGETWKRPHMVGPGVADVFHPRRSSTPGNAFSDEKVIPDEIVARAEFAGQTWQARQPPKFLRTVKRPDFSKTGSRFVTWSSILSRLNEVSYLEAVPAGGAQPQRFTTADGLAGNIVTDLAVCEGTLWAACVDIFNPETEKWDLGGLCRYDEKTKRWKRIDKIDGWPVRWVTLLQEVDGELWVGFREGDSVAGDQVSFGMGLYPGVYRPKATAIALARLKDGKWTTFTRPPRPESGRLWTSSDPPPSPPSEFPEKLTRQGDKVLLFTRMNANQLSGNWDVPMKGQVSLLDVESGKWRDYDAVKDVDADQIYGITCDKGEALVAGNRGLHRFDWTNDSWKLLDPKCDLKNSTFHAGTVVGDELWLGYGRQSFGIYGQQGISRFSEKTGEWSYMSPAELKTASPVRRIVALPNGDAWVLFGMRPYMGAAMRRDYFARDRIPRPTGLGRFANGRWEFPFKGPKKPERPRHFFYGGADDLVAAGDRLLGVFDANLYVGPSPWKKIAGPDILGFARAKDGKTLEILRMPRAEVEALNTPGTESDPGERKYELGTYSPESGKVAWKELAGRMDYEDMERFQSGHSMQGYHTRSGSHWVTMSEAEGGKWVLGPLGENPKNVLKTPKAIWMFSRGEIVRVDRKTVDALMEKAESETVE